MNDLRAAAQQALEALDEADTFHRNLPDQRARRLTAITALRAALAQHAEPEDAELSAALGWPGGISEPVLDRKTLLRQVADIRAALAQQAEPEGGGNLPPPLQADPGPFEQVFLTDEEILLAVGWERAEMYMKLTPNFPVEEARKETIKNARAIERKVRGEKT